MLCLTEADRTTDAMKAEAGEDGCETNEAGSYGTTLASLLEARRERDSVMHGINTLIRRMEHHEASNRYQVAQALESVDTALDAISDLRKDDLNRSRRVLPSAATAELDRLLQRENTANGAR
ncbi:hypothetical protein DIPPA_29912 [Diplonema papillatum]|nr:hypothetical protein DIPPA_29912 [Diplonema papillatum]